MSRNRTLFIAGAVGALVLLLGGAGVAYASAQGLQPPADDWPFYGRGCLPGGRMFGWAAMRGGSSPIQAAAEATELSEKDVIAALRDGQTLAEIAEDQDIDPQDIVDVVLAQHRTRLQTAVDAGRMTVAEVEEMLAEIEEQVTARLDEIHEPRFWSRERLGGALQGRLGGGSWTRAFDAVAEALGLDPTGLFARLHGGESVAEIAEDAGVDLEAVQEAVRSAHAEERIQAIEQAVEDGRLSEEQGQWLLEGLGEGYVPGGRGPVSSGDCGFRRGVAPLRGGRNGGRGW